MADKNGSWVKWLGGVWTVVGLTIVGGGVWLFWSAPGWSPQVTLWVVLFVLAWGAVEVLGGVGLLAQQGWAQGIMVSTHALLAFYALALLLLPGFLQNGEQTRAAVLGMFALVNVLLIWMFSQGRLSHALSSLPLQTVYLQARHCEFCGTPLDPQTQTCPHCEAIPAIVWDHLDEFQQRKALLVSEEIGVQFLIMPVGKTRIGRGGEHNQINLNNPTISRNHAWIEFQGGQFVLYADDDANGTFVNDQRVRRCVLHDGDRVRLGRMQFRFVLAGEEV